MAMISGANGSHLGLLSFLSFALSVIAAVLAIDTYTLLRTGEFGKTWRVLIIASVLFALLQAVRMAEFFDRKFASAGLSQIVELMFVLALAFAFFLQRQAFAGAAQLRAGADESTLDESGERRRSFGERRRRERRGHERGANESESLNENPAPGSDAAASQLRSGVAAPPTDGLGVASGSDDIEWSPPAVMPSATSTQ